MKHHAIPGTAIRGGRLFATIAVVVLVIPAFAYAQAQRVQDVPVRVAAVGDLYAIQVAVDTASTGGTFVSAVPSDDNGGSTVECRLTKGIDAIASFGTCRPEKSRFCAHDGIVLASIASLSPLPTNGPLFACKLATSGATYTSQDLRVDVIDAATVAGGIVVESAATATIGTISAVK